MPNFYFELPTTIRCPHTDCKERLLGRSSHLVHDIVKKPNTENVVGYKIICPQCDEAIIHCSRKECDYAGCFNKFTRTFLIKAHHHPLLHQDDDAYMEDASREGSNENESDTNFTNFDIDAADFSNIDDDNCSVSSDCSVQYIPPCVTENDDLGSDDEVEDGMVMEEEDDDADMTPYQSLAYSTYDQLSTFHQIFEDRATSTYFYHQHQTFNDGCNVPGGIRALVYLCLHKDYSLNRCEDKISRTLFSLLLTMHGSTNDDNELILDVIKGIFVEVAPLLKPGTVMPPLPLTMENVNSMILTRRFSMLRNLPIQRLEKADNVHAIASIEKTIDIMMGSGVRPSFIQDEFGVRDTRGINGSLAATTLLQELRTTAANSGLSPDNVAIGWITLWSDSFLASWIKQKLNSAWVLTMTVAHPSGDRSDLHTFIIAIGPSKAVHHNVVIHALREVKKLGIPKLRYCGATNKFIHTSFDIIAYLSDRPERNHLTFTSLLGNFGKRFGWAAFCCKESLPSCTQCFQKRVNCMLGVINDSATRICDVCADWDYNNSEALAWTKASSVDIVFKNHAKGADAYPVTNSSPIIPRGRNIPEQSHIRPHRQTFEWLIFGIKVSFWMVAVGQWFKFQSESFLKSFGINTEARNACYKSAISAKNDLKQLSEAEKNAQLLAMLDTQRLVSIGAIPAIWFSCCSLSKFLDVPMHLFFTGITSDLINLVQNIMAKAKRKTKFNQHFSKLLQEINLLRLEWIKCAELPNTQWASENYIAVARIFSFLIGFYCHHFDPCNGGITFDNMYHLRRLSNSFQLMIASLMRVDDAVTPEMLDNNIKLFLSCWNECEGGIDLSQEGNNASSSGNAIFTKGNFLSLLNIPDQVKMFGPSRHYYEGNNEFHLQKIKKPVDHVRDSQTFFERKLLRHMQSERLAFMRKEMRGEGVSENKWKAKRYYRHKSANDVEAALTGGRVLSVVKFAHDNSSLYVSVDRHRKAAKSRFMKVYAEGEIKEICGLLYCPYKLDRSPTSEVVIESQALENMLQLAECGILLSFGGEKHPGHTLISEGWKTMNRHGVLDYPVICNNLFSNS